MVARKILLVFLLSVAAVRVYASIPAPTIVSLPCRNENLVPLINYYTAKTISAQLHKEVRAETSRFSQTANGKLACITRVDIDYDDGYGDDVGWVHYSLPKTKPFSVFVSYKFAQLPSGYTLPTDSNPQLLDASLLTEMKDSQPKNKPFSNTNIPSVPIVEFEILSEARQRLLAAGWHPRKTLDPKHAFGSETDFLAAGYTEVESCAADWDYCKLNYLNAKGACLSVTSEGEEPKDAFVSGWDFSCPAKVNRQHHR